MSGERLEVAVTFDERRGYVATVPDLAEPITALSLGGVRRRVEALLLPEDPIGLEPRPRRPSGARPAAARW
jgi:hypothetical protein